MPNIKRDADFRGVKTSNDIPHFGQVSGEIFAAGRRVVLHQGTNPDLAVQPRQALQLNASLPEAWNGLGLIRCSRGQYRDATNYFNAAMRYAPGFAPAHLNQAILLQQSFKNRPLALKKYQDYLAAAGKSELAEEVQQIVAKLDAGPRSTTRLNV